MTYKALPGICCYFVGLGLSSLHADQTTVALDSGSRFVYDQNTAAMNPLSGGTAANGDGTVLQLGYFSNASIADNFLGTWVPLSGETSLNTAVVPGAGGELYNQTSIGDITSQGGGNATFFFTLNFVAGNAQSGNSLPSSPTIPLAIRFYNNTSIATSTYYNVVSDDLWLWKTPATPPVNVNVSLDDAGLDWLSTRLGQPANAEFHTSIPLQAVPEPTTIAAGSLCAATLIGTVLRRRRAA